MIARVIVERDHDISISIFKKVVKNLELRVNNLIKVKPGYKIGFDDVIWMWKKQINYYK